jgi:hypothetical protein
MNSGPPEVEEGLYRDPPGENQRPVLALEPTDSVHLKHENMCAADYRIETVGKENIPDCLIEFVRFSDGGHYYPGPTWSSSSKRTINWHFGI